MHISAIHTEKVTADSQGLFPFLDTHISEFVQHSILVVTSKVVSICEGRVVKIGSVDKQMLIESESEYFIPPSKSKYNITLTQANNLIMPSAGIDESNGNGFYVLWPQDPQKSANSIREYLCRRFGLTRVGVIISDSRTSPQRWGTTGVSIAHSGFAALNNYIGTPDIFGRKLVMTQSNIADALAQSAVVVMGEGREQTPLAVISDIPFVRFQQRDPTQHELHDLHIDIIDDVYAPLLTAVDWKQGGRAKQIYWVYVLRTSKNTLYVGQTKDLETRLEQHKSKSPRSAKYLRYFDSFELVYVEKVENRSAALKREAALKRLSHKQKEAVIAAYLPPKN